MDRPVPLRRTVCRRALPDHLIQEALYSEHRIHEHLQVVARRRVTVQVDRRRRFHGPSQFAQPRRHHHQVGQHIAGPEERTKCLHAVGHLAAGRDQLRIRLLALLVPRPGVRERLDLPGRLAPILLGKEDVVVGVRVKGRVEVHQVDGLVTDVPPQDVQVIPVVQRVLHTRLLATV